jgi:hypothetical protein
MKIVFLDIDGVLNTPSIVAKYSRRSNSNRKNRWVVGRKMMPLLNQIRDETGAEFVISSAWRTVLSQGDLQFYLAKEGFLGALYDRTPCLGKARGEEILQWMMEEEAKGIVLESFVVVDDITYDIDEYILEGRVVAVDENQGLTEAQTSRIIRLLKEPVDWRSCSKQEPRSIPVPKLMFQPNLDWRDHRENYESSTILGDAGRARLQPRRPRRQPRVPDPCQATGDPRDASAEAS